MKPMTKLSTLLTLLTLAFSAQTFAKGFERDSQFGPNPGNLAMIKYVPSNVQKNAPMVVVLHGCMQDATFFGENTGWKEIADRGRFILLLPEQTRANNGMGCFTWFEEGDIVRSRGEVASVANMIEHMVNTYSIDEDNIYATGLSAGATMAAALMASYPDKIKGGALVSGVNYGCAALDGQLSFMCMFMGAQKSGEALADYVRKASEDYSGDYPKVTLIHGTRDNLVNAKNVDASLLQWTSVHGTDTTPNSTRQVGKNLTLEEFRAGNEVVTSKVIIPNGPHGWPVDSSSGCGRSGNYIVDTGFCAAKFLAEEWGIL
jgi:poly(hydroxyalkanoate) depolymerase family esterase